MSDKGKKSSGIGWLIFWVLVILYLYNITPK